MLEGVGWAKWNATSPNKVLPAPLTSFASSYMASSDSGLRTRCSVFSGGQLEQYLWWATSATQERYMTYVFRSDFEVR